MTAVQRRPRVLVVVAISCLFALMAMGAASTAAAAPADTLTSLANDARSAEGKPPLARNGALDAVALRWAKKMAADGSLSHNPDVADQIPAGWRRVGENVAQGYQSANAMHQGWMGSSGHRANILGDYTDIGVAFYRAGGTTWGVQVFGSYPGRVEARRPEPTESTAPAPTTAAPTTTAPRPRRTTKPRATASTAPKAPKATAKPTKKPAASPTPSTSPKTSPPTSTATTDAALTGDGSDPTGGAASGETTAVPQAARHAVLGPLSRPMTAGALALSSSLAVGLLFVAVRRRRIVASATGRHRG